MYKLFSTLLALFFFLLFVTIGTAHEEPAKTLKEKIAKKKAADIIVKSNVRSCTSWNYKVEAGNISNDSSKSIIMEYDRLGNLSKISAYKNDSLTESVEYTYSNSGDMLTDIDYAPDGSVTEKNIYTYDNEGRVLFGECRNRDDKFISKFKYTHDAKDSSITFSKIKLNDSLEYSILYKYQGNYDSSDFVEATKFDSLGKQILNVRNIFNERNLLEQKTVIGLTDASSYTFFYTYNESEQLIEVKKVGTNGKLEWKRITTYDMNGNRFELRSYDDNSTLLSCTKYTYTYFNDK